MVPEYNNYFRKNIDVVEHNGRIFGIERGLADLSLARKTPTIEMEDASQDKMTESQEVARESSMTCAFLLG